MMNGVSLNKEMAFCSTGGQGGVKTAHACEKINRINQSIKVRLQRSVY